MKSPIITFSNSFLNLPNKETFFRNHFKVEEARLNVTPTQREEIVYGTNSPDTAFPTEIFPEKIQQIIRETNIGLQFPVDFIGASILFATSVAIGNTFRVEVKRGWQEHGVLYMAIVGRPGTNKTAPLKFSLKPLLTADESYFNEYGEKSREYTAKKSSKGAESEDDKPTLKKFIVSDITAEALANVHGDNRRGIAAYVDELAGWFKNFNKYNNGSEQEFWCSIWSGSPIIIDRKTSEPTRIAQPFIGVCGTIQPALLNEMAGNNRGLNGFIDRIMLVVPEGLYKKKWTEDEIDPECESRWSAIINRLIEIPVDTDESGTPKPRILKFSPGAYTILAKWQEHNATKCNQTEDEVLSGIYTKLEIYCIRLSLILHMLRHAGGEALETSINEASVEGAIALAEYFRRNSEKAHSIIYESSPVDLLPGNKKRFYNSLSETFKTGDAIKQAEDYGISERTLKRMLKDASLFRRLKQGEYEKLL